MNRRVARYRLRALVRHPRRAVRLGLLASSLFVTVRLGEVRGSAASVIDSVKDAATHSDVHAERRRAARHTSRSVRRAKRLGVHRSLTDRRVARDLRRASLHASRAVSLAVRPPPRRRRKAAIVVAGTGAMTAFAYGRLRSSSPRAGAVPTTAGTVGSQANQRHTVDIGLGAPSDPWGF